MSAAPVSRLRRKAATRLLIPTLLICSGAAGCAAAPAGGRAESAAVAADRKPADGAAAQPAYSRRLETARQRDFLERELRSLREVNRSLREEIDVLGGDLRRAGERVPDPPPDLDRPAPTAVAPDAQPPAGADEIDAKLHGEVLLLRAQCEHALSIRRELLKHRLHLRNELKLRGGGTGKP